MVSSVPSVGPELLVEETSWGQGQLVAATVEFGEDLSGWIWLQLGLSQNRSDKKKTLFQARAPNQLPTASGLPVPLGFSTSTSTNPNQQLARAQQLVTVSSEPSLFHSDADFQQNLRGFIG